MARCKNCQKTAPLISSAIGVCLDCIRSRFIEVSDYLTQAHQKSREKFDLPAEPPKDPEGVSCNICVNECKIPEGGKGYCGLRKNVNGILAGPTEDKAYLTYYHDNLPTNCVAEWACAAGTGCGYPEFAHTQGPEFGYRNLAVFYIGCSFDCFFCQNWHYREELRNLTEVTSRELLKAVDDRTSCICYFGGDPIPQLPHAIKFSREARKAKKGKILRICWETNGNMHPKLLKEMMEISLVSGGCVKFDLKAYNEGLNIALCGVSNKRTFENLVLASEYVKQRKIPPILVASTLLVPGYVDKKEVSDIANFLARLDSSIPYSLLAFAPNYLMTDLPCTSSMHAKECFEAAKEAGLKNVHIGNIHLLRSDYEWS